MDSSSILAIVATVISVGTMIIGALNHTRVRSMCCGKKLEVSLDVEKTTPPADSQAALKISVPQAQAQAQP